MHQWLGILLLCLVTIAYGEIYMVVEDGNITYSDTPMKNAKVIKVTGSDNVTTTSTESSPTKTPVEAVIQAKKEYKIFRIISPKDQETIPNQPTLILDLTLDPVLQPGDQVQVYVDGQPKGKLSTNMRVDAGIIDRGIHEVYAAVIDKDRKHIMQSNVITIYFHQAHVGFPTQTTPPRAIVIPK